MSYPKILVAAPTSDHKDYCLKQWSNYLLGLTYPNKEIFIVDNSKDPLYHQKIISLGLPCVHHRPLGMTDLKEIITSGQNLIRDKILREKFDYLFLNESDQFAPPNIIEYLMLQKKFVIGLPYFISGVTNTQLICFKKESWGAVRNYDPIFHDEGFIFFDGTITPVYQLGFGCLLIHRSIVERLPFRVDMNNPYGNHSDTYFHNDCHDNHIPVYADLGHMSYHWNKDWWKVIDKENSK